MKRQRDSDNGDESSCCQPLCFSPPLCLQHCNTNSWREKKKKDKKEKKLLSPPISACADPTACCKIPSLSKETACSSIHYLETQREQASKDAFTVFSCAEHLINLPYKCFTFAKSRENDFLAGQPFIQQNAYVLFVRYISRTCDSVISLKFW